MEISGTSTWGLNTITALSLTRMRTQALVLFVMTEISLR